MLCRRSKYVDFFIFASFFLLFVYAYFSRQVLLDRLHRKEMERGKLEHNAKSLKEELKIVYYHTAKLEEALKTEQDNHKITNGKLGTQSRDFQVNLTNLKKQYAGTLKAKDDDIQNYSLENRDLKLKHKLVEEQYAALSKEHEKLAVQVHADYEKLKKEKEDESTRLQDQIQDTYNQKIFFQKKALTHEDDYKKTLKKLGRCKSVLARRNATKIAHIAKIARKKASKSVRNKVGVIKAFSTEGAINVKTVLPGTSTLIAFHEVKLPMLSPTELVHTFNQPRVLPAVHLTHHNISKGLPSRTIIGSEERTVSKFVPILVAAATHPLDVPVVFQEAVPVKNKITEAQVIGVENKNMIMEGELSREKTFSPVMNKIEKNNEPLVGVVDIGKDNT